MKTLVIYTPAASKYSVVSVGSQGAVVVPVLHLAVYVGSIHLAPRKWAIEWKLFT